MSKILKFFNPKEKYGEFSNFFNSTFTIKDIEYDSVEQYFQAQKFYDPDNKKMMKYFYLIINADSPQKIKDLGNQKKNYRGGKWLINKKYPEMGLMNEMIDKYKDKVFIRKDWDEIRDKIMYKGLKSKFNQNPSLKKLLIKTKDRELVENSPYDKYWGIGKDGTGENKLGELLMKLRKKYKKEENND